MAKFTHNAKFKSPPIDNPQVAQFHFNMADIETANVKHVDPVRRLIRVKTLNGKELSVPIANCKNTLLLPPNGEKWQCMLAHGTGGAVYILWFIPPPGFILGNENQIENSFSSAGEDIDETETHFSIPQTFRCYKNVERRLNYRDGRPIDAIPGDDGIKNHIDGNELLIGRGGINMLKVDELCQIVQMLADHMTRIVSRNMQWFTDWGAVEFLNKNNQTKLVFKGNDRNTKTREGVYDFTLEIGACNDPSQFLALKFDTNRGDSVKYTIDKRGNMFFSTPEDEAHDVKGDRVTTIAGTDVHLVGGDYIQEIDQSSTITVSGDRIEQFLQDRVSTVDGDETRDVGGKQNIQVDGNINENSNEKTLNTSKFTVNTIAPGSVNLGGLLGKELVNKDFIGMYKDLLDIMKIVTAALVTLGAIQPDDVASLLLQIALLSTVDTPPIPTSIPLTVKTKAE